MSQPVTVTSVGGNSCENWMVLMHCRCFLPQTSCSLSVLCSFKFLHHTGMFGLGPRLHRPIVVFKTKICCCLNRDILYNIGHFDKKIQEHPFTQGVPEKKIRPNPPRISLGVGLKVSKRISDSMFRGSSSHFHFDHFHSALTTQVSVRKSDG